MYVTIDCDYLHIHILLKIFTPSHTSQWVLSIPHSNTIHCWGVHHQSIPYYNVPCIHDLPRTSHTFLLSPHFELETLIPKNTTLDLRENIIMLGNQTHMTHHPWLTFVSLYLVYDYSIIFLLHSQCQVIQPAADCLSNCISSLLMHPLFFSQNLSLQYTTLW